MSKCGEMSTSTLVLVSKCGEMFYMYTVVLLVKCGEMSTCTLLFHCLSVVKCLPVECCFSV